MSMASKQSCLSNRFERGLVSTTVVGELIYGALHSARVDENIARTESLMTWLSVVTLDAATAYEYGKIKQSLRIKGRMIPDNDIWIAACCIQHDITLVSRDRHFSEVGKLALELW